MKEKKAKSKTSPSTPSSDFPIVAIGASAGGLEAVSELFKNLSPSTGMAFLYVQHLSPDHKSMLSSLLAKITSMKVQEAANKEKMLPNNVYVIPADKEMNIVDGFIKITPRPETPKAHLPIDILFSSLAERHKENVIGIILSGSATDGTRGMKSIKNEGGLTFAQDASAKFGSMPMSAIAAGAVDFVLSPTEIAQEISRLSTHPFILSNGIKKQKEKEIDNNNPDLKIILNHLYKAHQVDFSQYKMNTIKRRIMRRMLLYKIKSLKEYAKMLREKTDEPDILYQDLLINVTAFFRDTEAHHYLKTTLLPKLLKTKKPNEPLRIWVAACATGEEAYSIAIALLEIQSSKFTNIPVQIFATDLDANAINKARIGEYSKIELEEVSPKRLQRFYVKSQNGYRVAKQVRDMCVFAQHNLLTDPPFARVDFVSCCNLLIYFDTAAQKKAIATFHYALNGTGFLMLGKSESIGTSTQFFSIINKLHKIFLRRNNTLPTLLPVLTPRFTRHTQPEAQPGADARKTVKNNSGNNSGLDKAIDAVMLSRYMPASVIINEQLEILQFRGDTDLYISPTTGKASLHILKMTRPEIAFELRPAISQAIKTKRSVRKFGIEIKMNDVMRNISIEVVPLKIEWAEPVLLILFSEHEQTEIIQGKKAISKSGSATKDRRIKKLEEQLEDARADTLAFTQEQEAFNEELQSANEEVVSSNEELQTINEELETSKEEIESANEELSTTNQELQTRNELLNESYVYSETLLLTVPLPLLILDSAARVKSANKAFYQKYNVIEEETEGHRIYDLGNGQWKIPKLRELLEDIIPQNTVFENYEVEHEFESIGKKIMILNARRIQLSGQQLILLAITDVTEVRKLALEKEHAEKRALHEKIEAEQKLKEIAEEKQKQLQNIFQQSPFTLALMEGENFVFKYANEKAAEVIGVPVKEIIGKSIFEILPEIEAQGFSEMLLGVLKTGKPFVGKELPATYKKADKLVHAYFDLVYEAFYDVKGKITGVASSGIDVTEKVLARKKIEESEKQYRQLVTGLPVAVYTCDAEGRILLYNEAAVQLWGRKPQVGKDEWCGSWKIFKTDGTPLSLEDCPMAIALKEGRIVQFEIIIERPDGTRRNVMPHPQPVFDSNGKIIGAINMLQDITEAKKAEEVNAKLAAIVQSTEDAIISKTLEGIVTSWNHGAENIFGYAEAEMIGEPITKIIPKQRLEEEPRIIENISQGKTVEHFETQRLSKEGKLLDISLTISPMKDSGGKIIGASKIARDITEQVEARKKIEESEKALKEKNSEMQEYLDNATIGLHWVNADGIIIWANKTEMDLLGYSKDEYIGHHIAEFHADQNVINDVLTRLANHETLNHYEAQMVCKDGSLLDVIINSNVLWAEDKFIHTRCFTYNVTEKKLAENKIAENEKQKAFLLKLSDALRPLINPIDIEEAATKIALDFMGADRCYYSTIERDNVIILQDASREDLPSVAGVHSISGFALYKAVLQAGRPFVVDDVRTANILDDDLKKVCLQFQFGSFINVPVIKNGKAVGLFSVVQNTPRKWTDVELQLTVETAERTWAAEERAKAEEALHKSEEKYRTLFTSIDQGFALCELIRNNEGKAIDFYVLEVNPNYEKQAGVSVEMVLGKTILQAFPALDKWWIETYAAVVDNQRPAVFEQYSEASQRWLAINAYPSEKDKFAILFSDITERKQAEEKIKESEKHLREFSTGLELKVKQRTAQLEEKNITLAENENRIQTIFEAAPDAVITMDHQGLITEWNVEAENVFGWKKDEVIGRALAEIIIPERYREQHKNGLKNYMRTGEGKLIGKPIEIEALKKDNTEIPVELKISASVVNSNPPVFIGFVRDISSRKKSENEIMQKNKDLEILNKELEAFTYISSHDLQEPLRKIQTFTALLLERENQNISDTGKDYFLRMQKAANRMQTLIQDLLAFSRVNTSERKFELTSLRNIIEEVKSEFKETITEKNATIETGEMCEVRAIPFQFRQLIQNLLSNALKFSKPGTPPHIIISGELLSSYPALGGREACHITFTDNGIGFEPQFTEKIFQLFQRLHGKDEYTGTGIGLAIVKKIIENHNGIISATSELGHGVRFDIYLPAAQAGIPA